jgi:hypothetical protein
MPDCLPDDHGLNVKALLDSLSLGFGESLDQVWQEKGRVGQVLLAAFWGGDFCPAAWVCCQRREADMILKALLIFHQAYEPDPSSPAPNLPLTGGVENLHVGEMGEL